MMFIIIWINQNICQDRTWADLRSILTKSKYEKNMTIFLFVWKIARNNLFSDVINEQQSDNAVLYKD